MDGVFMRFKIVGPAKTHDCIPAEHMLGHVVVVVVLVVGGVGVGFGVGFGVVVVTVVVVLVVVVASLTCPSLRSAAC